MTKRKDPNVDQRTGSKRKRKRRTREELEQDPFFRDQSGGNRRRINAQGKSKEDLGIDMRFTVDPQDKKFRDLDKRGRAFAKKRGEDFFLTQSEQRSRDKARTKTIDKQLDRSRTASKKLDKKFELVSKGKLDPKDLTDNELDRILGKFRKNKELEKFMGRS